MVWRGQSHRQQGGGIAEHCHAFRQNGVRGNLFFNQLFRHRVELVVNKHHQQRVVDRQGVHGSAPLALEKGNDFALLSAAIHQRGPSAREPTDNGADGNI